MHPFVGRLKAIGGDGLLLVQDETGLQMTCEWLVGPGIPGTAALNLDDTVLVQPLRSPRRAVVLGRIGPYAPHQARVLLESHESLSLKCGESSIDLRADGKVMIRGDDVLVRAKGTKRIRAGTVSIN
jgi:hypothetical protein